MNERIQELIIKELQGKITGQENLELQQWLIAADANKELYNSTKAAWNVTENYSAANKANVNAAWNKIESRLNDREAKIVPMYRRVGAIAASLLLLIGLGIFAYKAMNPATEMLVAEAKEQRLNVRLADGTLVYLNSNSTLSYPSKFSDTRNVSLRGEAFFEVAHDSAHPFIITAGTTQTRVLGTSFNVRAYDTEQAIEVSVRTGKVSFGGISGEKIFLLPEDMGSYDKKSMGLAKTKADANYLAWKTGVLQFDHTAVPDVVKNLERYYHASFTIKDEALNKVTFSGKLDNQPFADAIRILESSLSVRIIRDSAQAYSVHSIN